MNTRYKLFIYRGDLLIGIAWVTKAFSQLDKAFPSDRGDKLVGEWEMQEDFFRSLDMRVVYEYMSIRP